MSRTKAKNIALALSAIAFVAALGSTPRLASAQTTPSIEQQIQNLRNAGYNPPSLPAGFYSDSVSVDMVPQNPGPNQQVQISLTSYSTDLNRATIAWYKNGVVFQSGIGVTSGTVTTGDIGTRTTILIVINGADGNTTRQTISIIPAEVDLVWQADTYTPPFYEGKALYTHQSAIRIAAIPNFVTTSGTRLDPKTLVYSWKRDDGVNGTVTGYGKQSFDIDDNVPAGQVTVDVTVSSLDKSITAEKQIVIESGLPQLALYRQDPLLGILYQNALGRSYSFSDKEATIAAVPYFFSTKDGQTGLQYAWSLNGNQISSQGGRSITLRNQTGQTGTATLSLDLKSAAYDFQYGSAGLSVAFGNSSSNSGNFPQ